MTKKSYGHRYNRDRRILTNNFIFIDVEKYMLMKKYFSYGSIIEEYEKSNEYNLHKRQNKLERIFNI